MQAASTRGKFLFLGVIGGGVILFDQISKLYIDRAFRLHESITVIDGFFSLTYIRNPGAAFGLFAEHNEGFRSVFFAAVSVIALFLLAYFFWEMPKEETLGLVAISLLYGGAIGNMIDRFRLGEVIDFLDFYVGKFHWPAFNVADSAITVGISLLLFHVYFHKDGIKDKKPESRRGG
ncbi:MAG: signal peptidase II [Nitrospiria bacterium]